MDSRIKLLDRLKIQLQGHLYLGEEMREGWKEPAPVYMFKCPVHGYVKSTVRGHGRLECPECLEESKEKMAEAKKEDIEAQFTEKIITPSSDEQY